MDLDGEPQMRRRAHGSKFQYWSDKLAVAQTEPGLTTGQLMVGLLVACLAKDLR